MMGDNSECWLASTDWRNGTGDNLIIAFDKILAQILFGFWIDSNGIFTNTFFCFHKMDSIMVV